jgi:hypothetical protein
MDIQKASLSEITAETYKLVSSRIKASRGDGVPTIISTEPKATVAAINSNPEKQAGIAIRALRMFQQLSGAYDHLKDIVDDGAGEDAQKLADALAPALKDASIFADRVVYANPSILGKFAKAAVESSTSSGNASGPQRGVKRK